MVSGVEPEVLTGRVSEVVSAGWGVVSGIDPELPSEVASEGTSVDSCGVVSGVVS